MIRTGKYGTRYRWNAPIDYDSVAFCGASLFPESGDTFHDNGPQQLHGTMTGLDTSAWSFSRDIERWRFATNGTSYITAPLSSSITQATPFSVAFWAQRTDGATALKGLCNIQGADAAANQLCCMYWDPTQNNLVVGREVNNVLAIRPLVAITQSTLTHICYTHPGGSVRGTLYINGALNNQATTGYLGRFLPSAISFGAGVTSAYHTAVAGADLLLCYGQLAPDQIQWLADPANRLWEPMRRRVYTRRSGNRRRRVIVGACA